MLQGFRSESTFEAARQAFGRFQQDSLVTPELAVLSAPNYRAIDRAGRYRA